MQEDNLTISAIANDCIKTVLKTELFSCWRISNMIYRTHSMNLLTLINFPSSVSVDMNRQYALARKWIFKRFSSLVITALPSSVDAIAVLKSENITDAPTDAQR